ncbi:MAG: 16S rRNA (cytosine(967)-C(5))-methyltransferase RsmB [Cardiobacteriaceae bacterium]|nr:16S rRNA (cytosine(967)-C(5))-methyltransferase RsmB [Cardiobacteriaceae bacterium]
MSKKKIQSALNARQAAFEIIFSVVYLRESLSNLFPMLKNQVAPQDLSLSRSLIYGVLRQWGALTELRKELCKSQLQDGEKGQAVAVILNLGIFQLLQLNLAEYAVINETVNLTKKNGLASAQTLVNAVLRRVQREKEACLNALAKHRCANLPPYLLNAWKNRAEELAAVQSSQPPFSLRLRAGEKGISAENFLEKYPAARKNPLCKSAVVLPSGADLQEITEFAEGKVSVQDAGAQLAAEILAPKSGEKILDACAAPGGKTGHILEIAPNVDLLALDCDERRLEKISANLSRLALTAKTALADAADLASWWNGERFDAILLDAPCSGTGVIRRNPDIAFLRQEKDLRNFPKVQMRLLSELWKTLKNGGRLLYMTCSLLPRENNLLIEQFLFQEKTAKLVPLDLSCCVDVGSGYLHFPDADGDGFFYCLLNKA